MKTDKPLISILMAVYKPNQKWLKEQLDSLNRQTYPNIELLIYDDCPNAPIEESIIANSITNFSYRLIRGEKNLGSTKAFEALTLLGNGKYFSYCDQDDIWYNNKVHRMVDLLEQTESPLVCSDLALIDGEGNRFADSITKKRKRHIYLEGDGLAKSLLVKNFVTGCAMMIKANVAKRSVPFVDSLIHDQWLAINAALVGKIEVIREPLIDYRQHDENQTGVLKGIYTKQDYFNDRIVNMSERIYDYKRRLSKYTQLNQTINELEEFNLARERYFHTHNSADHKIMRKYREFAKQDVLFETFLPFMPAWVTKIAFSAIRHNIV